MEIQFLGATQYVTGSCYLITCRGQKILVECGLIQGSYKEEKQNSKPLPFKAAEIQAVVLTHAHIDHSGKIPLLVKAGFKGHIYTHHATRDLCEIMLLDSAAIAEKDAEILTKKRRRKQMSEVEPIYTIQDAKRAMPLFKTFDYNKKIEILEGIQVRFQDAGHILGSSIAEVWLNEKGLQRKLVFSGDLGHPGMPIIRDPAYIDEADLVIMESTYGDRMHRDWQSTWEEFSSVIKDAQKGRGNILIPAFAVGRTQEILYAFQKHFHEWDLDSMEIFLDSPMAIKATKVYAKHSELYDKEAQEALKKFGDIYQLPNLHLTESTAESMRINNITSGAIIIAGSGMCNGGRIKHHLKYNLWRRDCHVVFIGYQAAGTPGRALVDGVKSLRLWGEQIKVGANIHTIGGMSAHADQKQLLNWYGHFENNPPVVLVHGEIKSIEKLKEMLYEKYTVHAFAPKFKDTIDLKNLKKFRSQLKQNS